MFESTKAFSYLGFEGKRGRNRGFNNQNVFIAVTIRIAAALPIKFEVGGSIARLAKFNSARRISTRILFFHRNVAKILKCRFWFHV